MIHVHGFSASPKSESLVLLSSIYKRRFAKRTLRLSGVPATVLCWVTEGSGTLTIDQSKYDFSPGQLYCAVAGSRIEAQVQSNELECFVLFIESVAIAKREDEWKAAAAPLPEIAPFETGVMRLRHPRWMQGRIERLHELARTRSRGKFGIQLQFQELMHALLEDAAEPSDGKTNEDTRSGIHQSILYIQEHYHEQIKLEVLAEIAGLTPTSYSREFKRVTGLPPINYLNAHRISQAKRLLSEKELTVKEVSSVIGFGSEFYFSRMFKRFVGVSPTTYMKRKDIRVATASSIPLRDNLRSLGVEAVCAVNCLKTKTMDKEEQLRLLAWGLDQIRRAAPELILCDHYHLPYLEQLKQIAPTVVLEYSMDWRTIHRQTAEVIGREREAEHHFRVMAGELNRASQKLRRRFGSETVTMMRVIHKLIRVQGAINHPLNELLYSELGFKPGYCVPMNSMIMEFSPVNYPWMDTDHLFVQNEFLFPGDEEVFRAIQSSTRWQSTRAVSNNRIRFTPNWAAMSWSPIGRKQIIDQLLIYAGEE